MQLEIDLFSSKTKFSTQLFYRRLKFKQILEETISKNTLALNIRVNCQAYLRKQVFNYINSNFQTWFLEDWQSVIPFCSNFSWFLPLRGAMFTVSKAYSVTTEKKEGKKVFSRLKNSFHKDT